MPGPAAHLSIIQLQTARAKSKPAQYGVVANALAQHPTHAQFGAIGPDMLFWADWGGYTPIVNTIFDVYHSVDEIYEKLAALWKPIGDAVNKVETSLTGGLTDEISETLALVKGIIQVKLLDLITYQVNYWELLKPHFQTHSPHDSEKNWNWLDYTHHRHTGKFARELMGRANASGDDQLRAYAYGWLSHVTADVVGHPYVNLAAGGPWRTHFQRHHLQENFMDVWAWGFYHTPGLSFPASVPPFDYGKFSNLGSANLHTLIDLGDDLPDSLQRLLADSLQSVYGSVPHPTGVAFLGKAEVNRAYQMMKEAFELMTGQDRHIDPPQPPKVFGDMEPPSFPTPGGSGGGGGGSGGGGFSLANLLKAILDSILATLGYLADLALWLISKVTSPLTYPIRYALYLIQLGLYDVYRNYRWALVISAYMYPDADQLSRPEAMQFINPANGFSRLLDVPRLEYPLERDHSHAYPFSGLEAPRTLIAPYHYGDLNYPYQFIEGEPTSLDVEKQLTQAINPEETMQQTERLARLLEGHDLSGSLGSAVDFFLRRAAELAADGGGVAQLTLPDWNLDGDRGYGFHCWEADSKLDTPPASGVDVDYLP